MKRDMELIRLILLDIEANDNICTNEQFSFYTVELRDKIALHIVMLQSGDIVRKVPGSDSGYILPWKGRELLDMIRDDKRWKKMKKLASVTGDFSYSTIKAVVSQYLTGVFIRYGCFGVMTLVIACLLLKLKLY